MASLFPGFSREALDFFRDLEQNNQREWFQPRKEYFEAQVREPMLLLVELLNGQLARFAPEYVTDPKKAVFRIYRDTRFSANKTPYKVHIAASFGRRGLETGGAGYYFSISHKNVEVGGGLYHPPANLLLQERSHIADTHEEFRKLLKNAKLRKLMGDLSGDELTRAPKGFAPDHPAADLIRKKDWVLFAELAPDAALSASILKDVASRFEAIAPVLDYLNRPFLGRKQSASFRL